MSTPTSADPVRRSRQMQSLVTTEGSLRLFIDEVAVAAPGPDQVVVRIEAAPLNPSDLGLLLAGADITGASVSGTADNPVVTAPISAAVMRTLGGRVGEPMSVGNEGGGVVVEAGSSPAAQALLGRTVGVFGGAMYTQYRTLHIAQCLALPDGTTPTEGASCFVNPLTALGMVETMRREGHTALVHTAAASNLGQMLNRICLEDDVALVNIVRKPEQAELLRAIGAMHVCDSSSTSFMDDLVAALVATAATIAFDATGGGRLAGQILTAMEAALNANAKEFSRYGSTTHKQVYIYGGLDRGPTEFNRSFGMAWSIGGWLLTPFLQKIGAAEGQALRERVANGLRTTFKSTYTKEVSLAGALQLEEIEEYAKQATGTKYLITPNI
jgi:NADPH:quinone reductase